MIGSKEVILAAVVLAILPAAALACSCWWASLTAGRRSIHGARISAGRLRAAAITDWVVASAWVGIGILLIWLAFMRHMEVGADDLALGRYCGGVAPLVGGSLAFLTGLAKNRASQLTLQTVDEPRGEIDVAIDSQVKLASQLGTFYAICVGLGFLVVLPVPALMLGFVMVLLLPLAVMQLRSRRQNQLLWLLSIAVRQKRDLAEELEAHARAFGGGYAGKIHRAAENIRDGDSLGIALACVPGLLPRWTTAAIQTGEETGTLHEVLPDLAEHHIRHIRSQFSETTLLGITVHATMLLLIVQGQVAFLMYWIVPKFKAIFEGFGTELPRITELMIQVSDAAVDYGVLILPLILLVLGLVWPLAISEVDSWRSLKTRLLSRWYPVWDGPDIMRHLARLIAADKPVDAALRSIKETHQRPSVRTRMQDVFARVQQGHDCWSVLRDHRFVTAADCELIVAAERIGNLPWALRQLADSRERRLRYRATVILEFIRPTVVLALGGLVAFITVAFFMPLISLLNDLT